MGKRLNELRARVKKLERQVETLLQGKGKSKKSKTGGKKAAKASKKSEKTASKKPARGRVARTATAGKSRARVASTALIKAPPAAPPSTETATA